jgi:hypothetical protein
VVVDTDVVLEVGSLVLDGCLAALELISHSILLPP